MIERLVAGYGSAFVTHIIVSTLVLAIALAAATWIRPLTARTRHAILLAGMAALLLPPALFARLFERVANDKVQIVAGALPDFGGAPMAAVVRETSRIPWVQIAVLVWLAVAALLFLRWWLTTRRLLTSATLNAAPPPPRVIAALEAARRRLSLHKSVDIVASPLCEAPALVRVVRPTIVLPADGCAVLDDEELQSLLCHECAHVARRDNLIGVFEAVICSVFWFNPLVWIAHRRIAAAREAACDELVADSATHAETYVGALAKFCEALIAPRVAGVSCMASAHLKERIRHLMSYPTLQKRALSHRAAAATASIAVLVFIVAAGVVTANPAVPNGSRYRLNFSIAKNANDTMTFRGRIIDTETSDVIGEPAITVRGSAPAAAELSRDDRRWQLVVMPDAAGGGTATLTVYQDGVETQRDLFQFGAPEVQPVRAFTGEPISMDLENAEITDVLRTFSQLTGATITYEPEVKGKINVHYREVPWDEALDRVIRDNGYSYRTEGNTIHVTGGQQ